jgi:hypothetical protein
MLTDSGPSGGDVARLRYDGEVGLTVEYQLQPTTDHLMIVSEDDPHRSRLMIRAPFRGHLGTRYRSRLLLLHCGRF